MKLWISGEVDAEVFDDFQRACVEVEDAINEQLEGKQLTVPLNSFDCIAIVRNDTKFPERTAYSKAKNEMDFRLVIPFTEFFHGSSLTQRALLVEMLLRAVHILKVKLPDHITELEELSIQFSAVASSCGWTR